MWECLLMVAGDSFLRLTGVWGFQVAKEKGCLSPWQQTPLLN